MTTLIKVPGRIAASRVIAGPAFALLAALLAAAPAAALDLSGGTLRGAPAEADEAALADLAALDLGAPAPSAEDQLDAIAEEDAALGIEASATFVPVGAADDAWTDGEDATDMLDDDMPDAWGDEADAGDDMASFVPVERYVESIPVLSVPDAQGFRPNLPRATTSVVPLGSWTRNNPRTSTVVLGGSWNVQ